MEPSLTAVHATAAMRIHSCCVEIVQILCKTVRNVCRGCYDGLDRGRNA